MRIQTLVLLSGLTLTTPAFAALGPAADLRDCTSSATATRDLSGVNIMAGNNQDLVGVSLLQMGLRARELQKGTEGQVIFRPNGVTYQESHPRGRLLFEAGSSGTGTTVTVSCCSSDQPVTQELAEKVCEAMINKAITVPFAQPESQTNQLLTFYNDADRPTTVHAFTVGLMKQTKTAVPGATTDEVREALGEPTSKSGPAGGETWTYGDKTVRFTNSLVTPARQ